MTIREVNIAEQYAAALPLLRENWQETGFGFEFAPDLARYAAMQAAGCLIALGAFDDAGAMIGYCTAVVTGHAFNPAVRVCSSDGLFMRHDCRGGFISNKLMLEVERIARENYGAQFMAWHTRAGTPVAVMMLAHGYEAADTVVLKRLEALH